MKVFYPREHHYRNLLQDELRVKPNQFRAFVDFVHKNFNELEPITPMTVVKKNDCPVRDEETAGKYLFQMQKNRLLSLKSVFSHGKCYFIGCTPEHEAMFKRKGLEGWVGMKATEFLHRRPLLGGLVLQRIYRYEEYGEPLFPFLATLAGSSTVRSAVLQPQQSWILRLLRASIIS